MRSGGIGFWIGARRARGSHGDTCMFDQWKWMDAYGRAHGIVSGFTAFVPGKPDKFVFCNLNVFIKACWYQNPVILKIKTF